MAKILSNPVKYTKEVYAGGIASGMKAGVSQGILGAIGIHPFLARLGGGLIATAMTGNKIDKRIILVESTKEAVYQLLAGE